MSGNPFPGPQPYRAADRKRFYGRDALVKKLANQILARPATTVFGPSGAGKSSLLQAGVIPALEDSDDIRLVRVDAWPAGEKPLQWLVNTITSDLELGTLQLDDSPLAALHQSIDLAARQNDRPILIYLDQFEQLFITAYDDATMKDLLDGLTWLIRRKQKRELHLVLSLREDYLGRLRDWTRERPELTVHGFRVGPLSVGEMVKAMCRTAGDGKPPQAWNPGEIQSLMLDVRVPGQSRTDAAEVQSAFAQIVCRALWEQRAAGNAADMRLANAEAILHHYFDTTLAGLGSLQEPARQLLERHLIDDEGHRTLLTEKEARLVLPAAQATEVLAQLEKAAVLHAEEHQGSRYFELGHDWLAKKVFERRKEQAELAKYQAARQKFRRYLGYSVAAWMILGSLVAWALVERQTAEDARGIAEAKTEEAQRQRDAAVKAEQKAELSSRMATARELMATDRPDLATLVLGAMDEPHLAAGWMQVAVDALKVRLPRTTFHVTKDVRSMVWSHDGTRIVFRAADKTIQIFRADRKGSPVVLDARGNTREWAIWSPDDQYVVAEGKNNSAMVFRSDGSGRPVVLQGHTDAVGEAAWSADGKRIFTMSQDKTIRVWNADGSGTPTVLEHPEQVIFAAWSPDGKRIVTVSGERRIKVWNADGSGAPIEGNDKLALFRAEWSPGSTRLAGILEGKPAKVAIWNADELGASIVANIGEGTVRDFRWSPDGKHLAVASAEAALIVNADGSGTPKELVGHTDHVLSATWSPDGKRLATSSSDKTVRIWNASGSPFGGVLAGNTDSWISPASWSPDGHRVMTVCADAAGRAWDIDGSQHPFIFDHNDVITSSAWSPDGKRVVTTSKGDPPRVWNVDGSGEAFKLLGHDKWVEHAAWSPDGKRIATASQDATVRVWNADGTGKPLVLRGFSTPVRHASWSPDGQRIAAIAIDSKMRIWNANEGGEAVILAVPGIASPPVMWNPDGKRFATISFDGSIRIWNADGSGSPILLEGSKTFVGSAAWSPDGKRLAAAGHDAKARIWAIDAPTKPVVFEGHASILMSIAWSPDGTRIVTTSIDGAVYIWQSSGDDKPLALQGHETGRVVMASFSPDGKLVVTAADDKTARVWNADGKGKPIVLDGHRAMVKGAYWSPDGKRILTVSDDNTARIWFVDIPLLQEALRSATTECLTPAERESFLLENPFAARSGYEACERKHGRTPAP